MIFVLKLFLVAFIVTIALMGYEDYRYKKMTKKLLNRGYLK